MFSRTICITSLTAALCGCAHAPQSYTFTASGPRDGAINAVAATLKKQGIEPGVIDYEPGPSRRAGSIRAIDSAKSMTTAH